MTPRLVIFDAFNTLVRAADGYANTFAAALRLAGVEPTAELFASLQSASAGLAHRQWSARRGDYVGWTEATLRDLRPGTVAALASAIIPALEQLHQAPMREFGDVADCVAGLRRRGIRLAVCSNWGWDLAEDLRATQLTAAVEIMVTSAQAGFRKPHPAIYHAVLDEAGVSADDAIFVGDNAETDLHGARLVGIRAVLISRDAAPAPGVPSIRSLAELPRYLELAT